MHKPSSLGKPHRFESEKGLAKGLYMTTEKSWLTKYSCRRSFLKTCSICAFRKSWQSCLTSEIIGGAFDIIIISL